MFHSIYIIMENGVSVFSKHFKKMKVDDQLISGFMSALGNFSTEALGSDLQSIKLKTGEQLSILKYPYAPIIGIVIADPRDHATLISEVLTEILKEFTEEYRKQILARDPTLLGQTSKFNDKIDKILKDKIASRTILKMMIGNVVSFSLIVLITILIVAGVLQISKFIEEPLAGFPSINFADGISPEEFLTLQTITGTIIGFLMLIFVGIFFLPSVLSGYIAGNEKRGILNAILLGVITGILLFIGGLNRETQFGDFNIFWWFLIFSPLLILIAITCGYYGGHLKARRKLWPLEADKF
jgi:hypothetical protein